MMQKTNNFVGDKPLVPDGFEAIVSEHIGWAYHMARRQLADAGLAEDAVQAVLLALWQRRKRLEAQNRSIGGWLVRATYFICSQMRKSEARRRSREGKAIVTRIQEADVPAEAAGSNILQLAAMDAAMQKLSKGDRALLVARFFQNRTAREVAQQFNISEAAAAKRTARAVEQMRNIMTRQRLTLDSTAMMALLAGGASTAPDGLASQVLHAIAGQGPLSACAARAAQSISFRAGRAPAFLGASAALVGVAAVTIPLVVKTPQRAAVPIPAAASATHRSVHIPSAHAAPHITGPLTKNGYVNYVAKFNKRFGQGVTALNNAAVPLVILFRPDSFRDSTTKVVAGKFINVPDKTFARKLRRSLGISKRDITGPRFVSYQKFRRHADPAAVAQGLGLAGNLPPAPQYTPAGLYRHPWSARTNPWTAAFLNTNAGALDIARSAFSRPHFFLPLVEPAGGDHSMATAVGSILPALAPAKAICNGLVAQAMLALHQGRLRRCQQDLLAVHRLARLLTREHFLITNLVAVSIEMMGCQADIAMANSHKLSSTALRNYLNQLLKLPRPTSVAAVINTGERWTTLDVLQHASPNLAALFGFAAPRKPAKPLNGAQRAAALASMNRLFDQVVKIFAIKNYRQRALASHHALALWQHAKKPVDITFLFIVKTQARTIAMSARCAAFRRLDRLSLALAAYLEAHQVFPPRLSQLVPKFLPAIPQDPYTNKPFAYATGPQGCTLFSPGGYSPPINTGVTLPPARPITVHLSSSPGI